jgi:riboflavin biosynthesis pyrimidine reductase
MDLLVALAFARNKEDNWITGKESKALVHQWRTEEQAILIGYNTALVDNPLLNARLVKVKIQSFDY